jgi:hypothetical protein
MKQEETPDAIGRLFLFFIIRHLPVRKASFSSYS